MAGLLFMEQITIYQGQLKIPKHKKSKDGIAKNWFSPTFY